MEKKLRVDFEKSSSWIRMLGIRWWSGPNDEWQLTFGFWFFALNFEYDSDYDYPF